MSTYRLETTLESDGKLVLNHLPFRKGEQVRVVIVAPSPSAHDESSSLEGSVLQYERPTDPVAEEDWEVLQ